MEDEWEKLRASMFPTSFGKQKKSDKEDLMAFEKTKKVSNQSAESTPGKEKGNTKEKGKEKENDEGKDDSGDEEDEDGTEQNENENGDNISSNELPITHEILLRDHSKTVSALALDPSGSRLVSGGSDYYLKLWDFNGMDPINLKPFRSIEPCGAYQIRSIQYSITGDSILVAPSSPQAKLFNREGIEQVEFIKGDQYIRDMHKTKGHVAALTTCNWHPIDKQTFITSSEDNTIRIWDVEDPKHHREVIVYKTNRPNVRNHVTACTINQQGNMIAAAATNGSIRIYNPKGPFHRPEKEVAEAHLSGSEPSCLKFSRDSNLLISRGGDDSLKLWDIRKFQNPIGVVKELTNASMHTDCTFSPDEKIIVTGTSVLKGQEYGKLVLLDATTLQKIYETNMTQSNVTRIIWHPKLNQIVVGNGNGDINVLYNPNSSVKGAKLCVSKTGKTRVATDFAHSMAIITPHALPLFQEANAKSRKRQREKIRSDPAISHKPEQPLSGPGVGGRVSNTHFTHHIMKTLNKDTTRDEDPREALLRYAKIAEQKPLWVAPVYAKNQPTPVFSTEPDNEDEDEDRQRKK